MTVSNSAHVWLTECAWCLRLGRGSLANTSCLESSQKSHLAWSAIDWSSCWWVTAPVVSISVVDRKEGGFCLSSYEQNWKIWPSIVIDLKCMPLCRPKLEYLFCLPNSAHPKKKYIIITFFLKALLKLTKWVQKRHHVPFQYTIIWLLR